MRIGLAGVPGSGKSALSQALKNHFVKNEKYKSVSVIDNYIDEIEKETDLALGFFGTYIGNTHVALGREYRERIAAENNDVTITCGTLFETSAYLAQKMELEFSILSKDEEKYDWNLRVDASMRMISCLYIDAVRYDKIYHLAPVSVVSDSNINTLEKNLQAAFNAFEIFPVVNLLAEGNDLQEITNNRVNIIIKDLESANNAKEQNVQPEESN
jgi:cytidylate kinase